MNIKDFVIQLATLEGGNHSAQATDPQKGRTATQQFRLPEHLDVASDDLTSRGSNRDVCVKSRRAVLGDREIGRLLYDALFQGEIGKRFQQFRPQSDDQVLRLELVLESGPQAAHLHNLPWELLYDDHFLALDSRYSIVRRVTDDEAVARGYGADSPPLAYAPKLRVLAVASDPKDLSELELKVEAGNLEKVRLRLVKLDDVSRQGLQTRLEEGFHVLHFMGHGDIVEGTPVLFFKDAAERSRKVSGAQLTADLLGLKHKVWPNLIVLNSCHGSAVEASQDYLRGVAFELIKAGVPAVVAMRREIPDKAAIHFSLALYRNLAKNKPVDEAVVRGRNAIDQLPDPEGGGSWSVPVLYSRLPQGRLFRKPFPWKPVLAFLLVLALLLASFLIREALRDIRIAFDDVVLTESGASENAALWQDIGALKMGLAVTRGIVPTEGQGDFRVAIRFEGGERPRLIGAIFDRSGRALPELIFQAEGAAAPEAIAVLKQKMLFGLLDRFSLLSKAAKGRIERLKPVKGHVLRINSAGVEQLVEGDLESAEASFVAAIEIDDDYAVAHANLAMLLFNSARYEEALPHARKAVERVDEFQLFHYNLGRILLALGDSDVAITVFRRALKRDPGYVAARHELAKTLMSKQNWPAARRGLAKCGNFPPAIKNLGRVDLETGEVDQAIAHLERALTLFPPDDNLQQAETRYLLARAYAANQQLDRACQERRAYSAIPYADRWEWARELNALDCEPVVDQSWTVASPVKRRGPFAFAFKVEGSLYKVAASGERWPVASRDALAKGQRLVAEGDGKATLVCDTGILVTLNGPGSWLVDEGLCSKGEASTGGLYGMLVERLEWEQLSLGATLTVASRGGDGDFLVDPVAATASQRPDLVWTDTSGTSGWQLTLRQRRRPRPRSARIENVARERLAVGSDTIFICRTPWPERWPSLRPGGQYLIEIEPAYGDGQPVEPIHIDSRLHLIEGADALNQRLTSIDELELDSVSRLELYAAAQCAAGDLSGTVTTCQRLFQMRGSDRDILRLAQAYQNAGLVTFAVSWLEYLLKRDIDISIRAAGEVGLGQAHLTRTRDQQALIHLARARALYARTGNLAEMALIDETMAEAGNGLSSLDP